MLSGEATNINFIIFGVTPQGLEPTIYHTRGQHASHYTTDAVMTSSDMDSQRYYYYKLLIFWFIECLCLFLYCRGNNNKHIFIPTVCHCVIVTIVSSYYDPLINSSKLSQLYRFFMTVNIKIKHRFLSLLRILISEIYHWHVITILYVSTNVPCVLIILLIK